MTTLAPKELEAAAIAACQAAAERIRDCHETAPLRSKSTATDIVTEADLAAEGVITEVLTDLTPGARMMGEERGSRTLNEGEHGAVEWVVDPLDGTVNFSYGLPIVAVSVAALVDGQPTAGAVVDLRVGEVYSAHVGGGARLDGHSIACRRADRLDLALIATGFSYVPELRRSHGHTVAALVDRVRDVRAFGSAALQLCWVAAGRLDAYFERDTKPWDYSAGSIIAIEAGAAVELPSPENDELVLAVHPELFDELRALVA